jgi:hypothetical protein
MMTVSYEWDVEVVQDDDENEVLEHLHQSAFADCQKVAAKPADEGCRHDIVLVRDDDDGRSWAYIEDGKLPSHFEDAGGTAVAKVPQRFHKEVLAVVSKAEPDFSSEAFNKQAERHILRSGLIGPRARN